MELILGLVILLYSAILHEIAHGWVADRLGDPTARLLGRLTLHPKSHIDPLMSIAVPLLLLLSGSPIIFGAAKPVPVDPFNLKEGRKDVALVSLAGPLTNVVIAVLASFIIRFIDTPGIYQNLDNSFYIPLRWFFETTLSFNLLLAIFNLLPIPPLDGSKVFAMLLPEKQANAYLSLGNFGMIILFILLLSPFGGFSLSSVIGTLLYSAEKLLLP